MLLCGWTQTTPDFLLVCFIHLFIFASKVGHPWAYVSKSLVLLGLSLQVRPSVCSHWRCELLITFFAAFLSWLYFYASFMRDTSLLGAVRHYYWMCCRMGDRDGSICCRTWWHDAVGISHDNRLSDLVNIQVGFFLTSQTLLYIPATVMYICLNLI